MIQVILKTKSNTIIGFEMSGHAEYDEPGYDIICSAVSVLAINTLNSIEAFTEDQFDYTVGENGGFLQFSFISDQISDKSELLLNAFHLGLQGIEQQYGNTYIDIKIEEV